MCDVLVVFFGAVLMVFIAESGWSIRTTATPSTTSTSKYGLAAAVCAWAVSNRAWVVTTEQRESVFPIFPVPHLETRERATCDRPARNRFNILNRPISL